MLATWAQVAPFSLKTWGSVLQHEPLELELSREERRNIAAAA